jgi:hypothetical protein
MTDRLDGIHALVTGAASGIGAVCARRMASDGTRLLLADVNRDGVKTLADELGQASVQVDVTRAADIQRMLDLAFQRWGRIDVLFNNAGIAEVRSLFELTEDDLIPIGRPETSEDVAGVVGFLASRDSDYMTGQAVIVDGGLVMGTERRRTRAGAYRVAPSWRLHWPHSQLCHHWVSACRSRDRYSIRAFDKAPAQNCPSRPITMVVPSAPGGPTDTIARMRSDGCPETMPPAA